MRRNLIILICLVCGVLLAQTKLDLISQAKVPLSNVLELAGWKDASLKRVQIGAGLIVTESADIITISAQVAAPQPTLPNSVFHVTTTKTFMLIAIPKMVYRNGLAQVAPDDYVLSSLTLSIPLAVSGDTILVTY